MCGVHVKVNVHVCVCHVCVVSVNRGTRLIKDYKEVTWDRGQSSTSASINTGGRVLGF